MDIMKTFFKHVEEVTGSLDVNVVFGPPETVGNTTIIPLSEVMVGFGGNAAQEADEQDQSDVTAGDEHVVVRTDDGGYARVRPIGYVEINEKEARVQPVVDSERITMGAFLLSLWTLGWVGLAVKSLLNRKA